MGRGLRELDGLTLINLLVPWSQIGIGISLILGLLTRFGATMGTLMMLLFFVAAWDFQFGIVNQHLTYALVTFFLGYIGSGNFYGLDATFGPRRTRPPSMVLLRRPVSARSAHRRRPRHPSWPDTRTQQRAMTPGPPGIIAGPPRLGPVVTKER